jgi:hypothetical protein
MADIPLYFEGDDFPEPRARADVRFETVAVQPYGDGRRVKLAFRLLPFAERPSVEATVTNNAGHAVASVSLIEAMEQDFEFTLHLRGPQPQGAHTLHVTLFYPESDDAPPDARQIVDERAVSFEIPTEDGGR